MTSRNLYAAVVCMMEAKNWHKYVWVFGAALSGMLVAVFISQFWLNPSFRNLEESKNSVSKMVSKKQDSSAGPNETTQNNGESDKIAGEIAPNGIPVEELAKIENYVREESKKLDIAQSPAREKQIEMTAMARQLTVEQSAHLSLILKDLDRPVNERILSAYLLSLSPALFAQKDLNEFASADLPNFGPATPHSEAEIRRNQELALRFMAIDRLSDLARDPATAKAAREEVLNQLRTHATQNPNEQLRKYAQSTLDELIKVRE